MASTVALSQDILLGLAHQAETFLPGVGIAIPASTTCEIAESFAVWSLPAPAVIAADPLSEARPTGMLYHQILRDGEAVAFAYSEGGGANPADWKLVGAFESGIAADIDGAIDVVDAEIASAGETRLLLIPAFQMRALWVVGDDSRNLIVPASFPADYQGTLSRRCYGDDEFFSVLGRLPHVIGIEA